MRRRTWIPVLLVCALWASAAEGGPIISPTHPNQGHWYYGGRFEAAWPDFRPEAARYACTVDWLSAPAGDATYPQTLETMSPAAGFELARTGRFAFTVEARDAADTLLAETCFLFNVNGRAPYLAYAETSEDGAQFDVKLIPEIERRGWTGIALPRAGHRVVAYRGRLWVFGGGYTGVYDEPLPAGPVTWSPDGVTWHSPEDTNCPMNGHAAAAFSGRLWLCGQAGDIWSSLDGTTWAEAGEAGWAGGGAIAATVFNGCLWVFLEHAGMQELWRSSDGMDWSPILAPAPWEATPVAAVLGDRLLAVTSAGVWRSADGVVWEHLLAQGPGWAAPTDAAALDGTLRVLDDSGMLWSSAGGTAWTAHDTGPWGAVRGGALEAWSGALWMVGGASDNAIEVAGGVWRSLDGVSWERTAGTTAWHMRLAHTAVPYAHALWILDGSTDPYYLFRYDMPPRVYSSANGLDWAPRFDTVPWRFRFNHTAGVLDGSVYVLGGNSAVGEIGDVWKYDGATWMELAAETPWGPRFRQASAVFDGKLWVLGGSQFWTSLNDVWWSEDGATWTQATASAGWGPRVGHKAVAFDGKLWVLGGRFGPGFNDVWYTEDGQTWEAAPDAPWQGRWDHAAAVYDGRLWVIGGRAGYPGRGVAPPVRNRAFSSNDLDDMWSTADGMVWREETPHAPWMASSGHTATAFENRLWILGSYLGATGYGPLPLAGSNWAGFRYCIDTVPSTAPGPDDPIAPGPVLHFQQPQKGLSWWLHVAVEDDAGYRSEPVHLPLGEAPGRHTADIDGDSLFSLSELLRVIQLYNSGGFECATGSGTEDGYQPGAGDARACLPHDSDYQPQDWRISISELLRLIQLYNSGGYHPCPESVTEDGYCPGPA